MKKKIVAFLLGVGTLALVLTGCTNTGAGTAADGVQETTAETSEQAADSTSGTETDLSVEELLKLIEFKENDVYSDYTQEDYTSIVCADANTQAGDGYEVDAGTVTIKEEGTYVLSGSLADGQLVVDADENADIRLIFDGLSIASSTSAPVYLKEADKVIISLAQGSENEVTDQVTGTIDGEELTAAIYSKTDLSINGEGSLLVNANAKDGITSKDSLVITGGNLTVHAADDGIVGKDELLINGGSFQIVSGSHGLKGSSTDADKGYVYLAGGSFEIQATQDGIHAENSIIIENGNLQIEAEDDGMHANAALQIDGGEITISKSYEGLEASLLTLNDGSVYVTAKDDGINGSGGNDTTETEQDSFNQITDAQIIINGGDIYIDASGDGIDSNGTLTVNGGIVVVSGPMDQGNTSIDTNGAYTVNGGTVLTTISGEGMAANGGGDFMQPADAERPERPTNDITAEGAESDGTTGSDRTPPTGEMPSGEMPTGTPPSGEIPEGTAPKETADAAANGETTTETGAQGMRGGKGGGGQRGAMGGMGQQETAATTSLLTLTTEGVSGEAGSEIVITADDGTEILRTTLTKAFGTFSVISEQFQSNTAYTVSINGSSVFEQTL